MSERKIIANIDFEDLGRITASLSTAYMGKDEDEKHVYNRLDKRVDGPYVKKKHQTKYAVNG